MARVPEVYSCTHQPYGQVAIKSSPLKHSIENSRHCRRGTKGVGEAVVRRLAAGGAMVATTARSPRPESQVVKLFVQAEAI